MVAPNMIDPEMVAAGLLRSMPAGRLFAYGQGSAFAGFPAPSDVDLVVIWAQVPQERLLGATASFTAENYTLDKLDSPPADVMHFTAETFARWCDQVEQGTGWHDDDGWPSPVHVVGGFVHGRLLEDQAGMGAAMLERMRTPSPRYVAEVVSALRREVDGCLDELRSCARRGDQWLFGRLMDRLMRHGYLAWFATEGHYCPFPKYLPAWVARLGMDADIARSERAVWSGDLRERVSAVERFVRRVG